MTEAHLQKFTGEKLLDRNVNADKVAELFGGRFDLIELLGKLRSPCQSVRKLRPESVDEINFIGIDFDLVTRKGIFQSNAGDRCNFFNLLDRRRIWVFFIQRDKSERIGNKIHSVFGMKIAADTAGCDKLVKMLCQTVGSDKLHFFYCQNTAS